MTDAQKAHAEAVESVRAVLERISEEITTQSDGAGVHWGHVGDLVHVHNSLKEVARFLGA